MNEIRNYSSRNPHLEALDKLHDAFENVNKACDQATDLAFDIAQSEDHSLQAVSSIKSIKKILDILLESLKAISQAEDFILNDK